jgi:hypothetical protein
LLSSFSVEPRSKATRIAVNFYFCFGWTSLPWMCLALQVTVIGYIRIGFEADPNWAEWITRLFIIALDLYSCFGWNYLWSTFLSMGLAAISLRIAFETDPNLDESTLCLFIIQISLSSSCSCSSVRSMFLSMQVAVVIYPRIVLETEHIWRDGVFGLWNAEINYASLADWKSVTRLGRTEFIAALDIRTCTASTDHDWYGLLILTPLFPWNCPMLRMRSDSSLVVAFGSSIRSRPSYWCQGIGQENTWTDASWSQRET